RPDTVLCRCEGTDYRTLRRALERPARSGARAVRLGTRAGLGPCQGRICGPTVAELTARSGGEVCTVHHRPIAQPIRLADLAGTPEKERDR
ncbi:(2Fe-2S)-binding protein, partial [Amycolatopsis cihanbeyliensis]